MQFDPGTRVTGLDGGGYRILSKGSPTFIGNKQWGVVRSGGSGGVGANVRTTRAEV